MTQPKYAVGDNVQHPGYGWVHSFRILRRLYDAPLNRWIYLLFSPSFGEAECFESENSGRV